MADDDEHDDHPPNPLAFILSGGMDPQAREEHRKWHERQQMARQDYLTRLHRLMDELDVEQLITLRSLMNIGDEKQLQFVDGQIYSILRVKWQVDPDSGQVSGPESLLDAEVAPEPE